MEQNIVRNLRIFGASDNETRNCGGDGCGDGCHSGGNKRHKSTERIQFAFKPDDGI